PEPDPHRRPRGALPRRAGLRVASPRQLRPHGLVGHLRRDLLHAHRRPRRSRGGRAAVARHHDRPRATRALHRTPRGAGDRVRALLALRGRAVARPLRRGVPAVIARVTALVLLLMPGAAWACATCVSSAYGDRTFNW